ncbi:hypothetical protein D3C85_1548640 [compost metagenome]
MRHQFGEKRPAFQTAKPFGLDVGQIEEVFADGIPERRVPFIVAVADNFSDHCGGETLRVGGDKQQARTRQELGMWRAFQAPVDVETA